MFYPMQSVLRLCRRRNVFQNKRYNHERHTSATQKEAETDKAKDYQTLLQENLHKITFSSFLEHDKLKLGYFKYYLKTVKEAKKEQTKDHESKSLPPLPVSLQYYVGEERLLKDNCEETADPETEKEFQLPLGMTTQVELDKNDTKSVQKITTNKSNEKNEFDRSNIKKWMLNYEHFDDTLLEQSNDEVDNEWSRYYGTPDPSLGVSRVACGGCGALLHSSDPAIPGYLPSEIFKHRKNEELKTMECQRCHFLKEYNIALDVSVHPDEYEKMLQSIRYVKSLVILMVDLLDFPCSIWPGIVDIVGTDRPIFIVANKVDLLPGDSIGYLKRVKESLMAAINNTKLAKANIKHVSLISAKTGYGVEDLISAMFKEWMYKGDVFLVGCTNVGKSSLFNALLQSDYCKVHAVDIIKRATVSRWPGTTLNLLKFPINRPSGWKIYQRTRRLKAESKLMKVEKEIRKAQLEGRPDVDAPTLMGHIGRSFSEFTGDDSVQDKRLSVLNERDKLFAHSKWFYDTPGVIHPDQTLSLLSTEELLLTIPRSVIKPQTYYLQPGMSLLIGGLARIDHVKCSEPCRFTVFCSERLPVTVVRSEHAQHVYETFVGTELLGVPGGGAARLRAWPGLRRRADTLRFAGEGPKRCCGDVVLGGVAWVGVTCARHAVCEVGAWTAAARGAHARVPALLPHAVTLKGKRLRDTPAYMRGRVFSPDD